MKYIYNKCTSCASLTRNKIVIANLTCVCCFYTLQYVNVMQQETTLSIVFHLLNCGEGMHKFFDMVLISIGTFA